MKVWVHVHPISLFPPTMYIYIKSTTVYVPSSELGLSHPLSRQRVCPSPGRGGHSPAGEGLGESQFRRLEKKLNTLPTLCSTPSMSWKTEATFHYCWRVKSSITLVWIESTLPMQLTDWSLVEVALLLIGLTHISSDKNEFSFDPLGRDQSSFRLPATQTSERQLPGSTCQNSLTSKKRFIFLCGILWELSIVIPRIVYFKVS